MKIGLQITARLKSSRLPFKLLLDLQGYSIVEHVINRAKQVKGIDHVVLCTSLNKQDKPLVDVALENDIYYYLGSEADVLQRLLDSANFFGFDYIINITGENPLFSVDHANQLIDLIKGDEPDFAYIEGLPIGCAVYGIKTKALQLVCEVKKEIDTEIWGPLINRPEIFKVKSLVVNEYFTKPKLRLTNDYFEDYMFMKKIFSHFPNKHCPSLYDVFQVLDQHPEYFLINKDKIQLGLTNEVLERIDKYYNDNHEIIKNLKKKIYYDL